MDPPEEQDRRSRHRRQPSKLSPEFYNSLSKIRLTTLALQELDRRNNKSGSQPARSLPSATPPVETTSVGPASADPPESGDSQEESESTETENTPSAVTKDLGPYDENFAQHCKDNNIYPPRHKLPDGNRVPKPANLPEIMEALSLSAVDSLDPPTTLDGAFEEFQDDFDDNPNESTLRQTVVPTISGNLGIPSKKNLPFNNLEPMTEPKTKMPKPDSFDGTRLGFIHWRVRHDLGGVIQPCKRKGAPAAANFFFEIKAAGGSAHLLMWQAISDGAIGTRAMFALQNYGMENPVYDGNAYAFSGTLNSESLILYAHHSAASGPGQGPNYYTTRLNSYSLLKNNAEWKEGIRALRNLRLLAQTYCEMFVQSANGSAVAG